MLLPLPTYLAAARDIESLPVGEGTIINTGPLALRKVSDMGALDIGIRNTPYLCRLR
jgi:hypothetical protein